MNPAQASDLPQPLELQSSGPEFSKPQPFKLQPFKHSYQLKIKSFINLSGKLTRQLQLVDPAQNRWQFAIHAKASFGLNSRLISDFILDDRQIRSIQLAEKKPGFGSSKLKTIIFSQINDQINNQVHEMLLDKANMQIQLRQDLLQGRDLNKLSYKVWRNNASYKNYRFRKIGTEIITTPAGKFNTLLIEGLVAADKQKDHKRLYWLSPEKDYLLVKFYQQDKDAIYSAVLLE